MVKYDITHFGKTLETDLTKRQVLKYLCGGRQQRPIKTRIVNFIKGEATREKINPDRLFVTITKHDCCGEILRVTSAYDFLHRSEL